MEKEKKGQRWDWLLALAMGDLERSTVVWCFIRYYALDGLGMPDVYQDFAAHTICSPYRRRIAMGYLRDALAAFIKENEPARGNWTGPYN